MTKQTLIKLPAVKERTCLSTSEIYRRIDAGDFPKQVKIGPKAVAWVEQEIDAWVEQMIAASRS